MYIHSLNIYSIRACVCVCIYVCIYIYSRLVDYCALRPTWYNVILHYVCVTYLGPASVR